MLAHEWGLPMISYGCGSSVLSVKTKYSTFARTVAPFDTVAPFVVSLMRYFGWTRIGLITSYDHVWQMTANEIEVSSKRELAIGRGSGTEEVRDL